MLLKVVKAPPTSSLRSEPTKVSARAKTVLSGPEPGLKVLSMKPGEVLELPCRADDPVELRVGDRVVAEGNCVRVGERFGLRVTSLRPPRA